MALTRETLRSYLARFGPAHLLRLAQLMTTGERNEESSSRVTFNLALQGGGALGAFTWGVLDRLSEENAVRINALSGASAGALNAAVYISGLMDGGRSGAARALRSFWTEISNATALANFMLAPMMLSTPGDVWRHALQETSRIGVRSLGTNRFEDIIARHIDIDAIRSAHAPRIYVSATHVLTARARIFTNDDLSLEALMASACVPTLHPTVWVDGEPYWDGGFSANPPLVPLVEHRADRTLLVRLIRSDTDKVPGDTASIDAHIKTILFSRPLEEELARIATSRDPDKRSVDEIDATAYASSARLTSVPTPHLVQELFEIGRGAAEQYLSERSAATAVRPIETTDLPVTDQRAAS